MSKAAMRDWWLRVHRWLGLAIAIFFAIVALTGSALVYQDELDAVINAGRFPVTPGDVGTERMLAVMASGHPDAIVERIVWPKPEQPAYQVVLAVGDSTHAVWIDPGTGREIEPTRPHIPLLQGIRRIHTQLLAGKIGVLLVVHTSALALFSFVTGLIIWWPGVRNFFRGFVVRTNRGFYAFNMDLHQAIGAIILPLLFLITLTGVLTYYEPQFTKVLGRVMPDEAGTVEEWTPVKLDERAPAESLPLGVLVSAAAAAVPEGRPFAFRLPASGTEPFVMDFAVRRAGTGGAFTTVLVDPRDASVLQVRDPKRFTPAARIARTLNLNLHLAGVGGTPVRILYVIVSFAGSVLAASGVLIWWLKRKKLNAAEERRSSRVEMTA